MQIQTYSKIRWRTSVDGDFEDKVYPSLAKKIRKTPLDSVRVKIVDEVFTKDALDNEFLPLYKDRIANREAYNGDVNEMYQRLLSGIETDKYRYASTYIDGSYAGGTVYSVRKSVLYYSHRVYDRELSKSLSLPLSIDFYMEKVIYDIARDNDCTYLSHGVDAHPRTDGIGLILFKLKSGVLPYVYAKAEQRTYPSESDCLHGDETCVFTDPKEGKFTTCLYLSREGALTNADLLREMQVVCDWAGIDFKHVTV